MASRIPYSRSSWPVYSEDPAWSDIDPLSQDDGSDPLAAIAYTEEYSEAMAYLRAVMAKNEMSERGLELTEHMISLNPAHYTVWLYRAQTLFALIQDPKDLEEEIVWLNTVAIRHQKNYQIWHHRQVIMEKLNDPSGEEQFIARMFEQDAKNYHVWSYRQWLVRHFDLWNGDNELRDVDALLEEDVRNNSAWNHRYFVIFGKESHESTSPEVYKNEIQYAKSAIVKAPQNQSPWNYLRGVLRKADLPLSEIHDFCAEFANLSEPDAVRSSLALDVLADIYTKDKDRGADAALALDLLAHKYDPIRANYWNYKRKLLAQANVAV